MHEFETFSEIRFYCSPEYFCKSLKTTFLHAQPPIWNWCNPFHTSNTKIAQTFSPKISYFSQRTVNTQKLLHGPKCNQSFSKKSLGLKRILALPIRRLELISFRVLLSYPDMRCWQNGIEFPALFNHQSKRSDVFHDISCNLARIWYTWTLFLIAK